MSIAAATVQFVFEAMQSYPPCSFSLDFKVTKQKAATMKNVKLGDEVYYPSDAAPFKVVGIRSNELELEGDWSGGTVHNYSARSWVKRPECKPYDHAKTIYFIKGVAHRNGSRISHGG